jgi:hypothetical protein
MTMVVLLIVLVAVVVLALALGLGGGFGGGYGGPVVYRRIIHRRPPRRVYTERHVVDERPPADEPVYRP